MNVILGGILNNCIQALIVIFALSTLILVGGGGLFAESVFDHTESIQGFEVPVVPLKRTDKNKIYMKTTYDKKHVSQGWGALEVDYNTSKTKYEGVEIKGYNLDKVTAIRLDAKADRHRKIALYFKAKYSNEIMAKIFDVTPEWKSYEFTAKDLFAIPQPGSAPLFFKPAGDFFITVPPQDFPETGKFWIDNLIIQIY